MSRTDRFSGDAKVAGTWRSRLYGLPMRLLFLTKQKNPELLPLIAADCAWGRLKERNRGSRIEAECLTVFNQAADLSTYRRGKSVRTTRATSRYSVAVKPLGTRSQLRRTMAVYVSIPTIK